MKLRNIIILVVILAVVGGVYYAMTRPSAPAPTPAKVYVWDIPDADIEHVNISLPREGKSESFIKISQGDQFPWFFDDAARSPVDQQRWGGGISLILSGPSADRVIAKNATDEQMTIYGLTSPSMIITLGMTDKTTMEIDVGDATPNGQNYYVRAPNSNGVATVDASWYQVLAALVTNPPYAK